jgi:methylenetetrahydrofolate reductase (NADPH)
MKIARLLGAGAPLISFEFFPPKTEQGHASLLRTVKELKRLDPGFVSVTWGAGGSTRRKTIELTIEIQREIGLVTMAHLTCVGSSRTQIAEALDRLESAGIENVLPLGGDQPEGYQRPADGFDYANELVEFVRSRWDFCLPGACYPETHPSAPSPEQDLANLVRKVEAGVDFLITQLFFDNADYFSFVERARAAGIGLPIVPGIMPVVSAANIRRITALCGARIPDALGARLDACAEDDRRTLEVGIDWATEQCRELLAHGAPGIHFYTLNRSPATRRIHENLLG